MPRMRDTSDELTIEEFSASLNTVTDFAEGANACQIERQTHMSQVVSAFLVLAAVLLTHVPNARSAEFNSIEDSGYIELKGEIKEGDAERLAKAMADHATTGLHLNSRGGDVNEAIRIATLVREARSEVQVSNRGICASSCFLIWTAGNPRYAAFANQDGSFRVQNKIEPFGQIGIHRPYFGLTKGDRA